MYKVIIESVGSFDGKKISGRALTAGISMNGNRYTKQIIREARNLGVSLPLHWEHNTNDVIGSVTFSLDKNGDMFYEAVITNAEKIAQLQLREYGVSVDARATSLTRACTPSICFNDPSGIIMEGLSLTDHPSVLSNSLIMESYQDWPPIVNSHCDLCSSNGSLSVAVQNPEVMTKEETSTTEIKENVATTEQKQAEAPAATESPKTETPKETHKVEAPSVATPAQPNADWLASKDEINQRLKEMKEMISEAKERINKPEQFKELDAMIEAAKNPYRVPILAPQDGKFANEDIRKLAEEMKGSIRKFGSYNFNLDLNPEIALNTAKLTEAITFSTSQSNVVTDGSPVYLLPGGKHIKSIRNLVAFDTIPAGADTINKAKGNIPANQSITEQSTITYNGHTITTIQLTADTVTGNGEAIKLADIEDSPFEIMSYLTQAARAEALEYEATLCFATAAAAATPNLWINANSGATITHTDIASMTMEPVSLLVALQDLETSGYYPEFGEAFCALHPKALRELRGSTNLTTLVQQGDANITKTGRLTHLYGIELNPCTAVDADNNTTNDVYNNVVGLKNHTFWMAAKRELEITMLKKANPLGVDFTWSQRKNATVFDEASFIRISSAQ